MKQNQTKFTCDHCSKKVIATGDSLYAPYDKGWMQLARLSIRIDSCGIQEKSDKHFCTKKCLINYIDETIKEAQAKKDRDC